MTGYFTGSLRRYAQSQLVFRWNILFDVLGTASMLLVFFLIDRFQGHIFGARLSLGLAHLNTTYFGYVALGIAVSELSSLGLRGVLNQLHEEKADRTLEYLMATPVGIRTWALGAGLINLVRALGRFAFVFTIAVLIMKLKIPSFNAALAALVLLVASVPLWCLALIMLGTSMVFRRGNPLLILIGMGFELLGGVYVPKSVLPGWLAGLGELLPITPAVRAMQNVVYGGAGLSAVSADLWLLAALTAAYLPAALLILTLSDRHSRRRGFYSLS